MTKKIVRKRMAYSDLSESTKERHKAIIKNLHLSGYTITEAKKWTWKEMKRNTGNKAGMEANKGYLRLLSQITFDKERRLENVEYTITDYKKFGYRGNKLAQVKKELIKTVGSTYFTIANDLMTIFNEKEKESYIHARDLLLIPKSQYDKLDKREKFILEQYGY